jgi:hypothetical protein
VVPVVAALDLDDDVPTGGGPEQVHRIHRRLGPGVAEPPQRQPEPPGELLGDDDGVLGGLREGVPRATRSVTARTIAGCAWPTRETPYPPCRSTYSVPSTS